MTLGGLVKHVALVEEHWFSRWLLAPQVHMIVEYARHNGHAESIDGATRE